MLQNTNKLIYLYDWLSWNIISIHRLLCLDQVLNIADDISSYITDYCSLCRLAIRRHATDYVRYTGFCLSWERCLTTDIISGSRHDRKLQQAIFKQNTANMDQINSGIHINGVLSPRCISGSSNLIIFKIFAIKMCLNIYQPREA